MKTILDTIAEYAHVRVAADKEKMPLADMRAAALEIQSDSGARFKLALAEKEMSFICEVKKASPSKGIIAEDFPYIKIAKEYEAAGADCISCLTEPKWFLGSDEIFREINATVTTPMLRKDFTVDEYQIYQAKTMGAGAVLLICALLDKKTLAKYLETATSLGLAALVEAHDESEIKAAVEVGAEIIGVNNRNLKDFTVDVGNSGRLRELVPPNVTFVSESGIRDAADVARLSSMGVDAVLIGETLMRAEDKRKALNDLRCKI